MITEHNIKKKFVTFVVSLFLPRHILKEKKLKGYAK
jgi:hypothetical protein